MVPPFMIYFKLTNEMKYIFIKDTFVLYMYSGQKTYKNFQQFIGNLLKFL